jgi:hypothetical protein
MRDFLVDQFGNVIGAKGKTPEETFVCRGCGSTFVKGTLCNPCYRSGKVGYEERGQ